MRTRRSTARAGKAELTRQAHGVEREKGTRGGNGSALANRAHETEREGVRGGGELPLTGGVRLSGGAGYFLFFFFSGFSNSFSISFL